MKPGRWLGVVLFGLVAHAGCGSDPPNESKIGESGGSGGSSGSSASGGTGAVIGVGGSSASGSGGTGAVIGVGGTGGTDDFDACAGDEYTADAEPVDLFVMLDQSVSMSNPVPTGGNIWQAVVGALKQFVDDPASAGIRVGLQYFGLPNPGGGACGVACNPAAYASAEVAIADLPGVAGAIKASLDAHGPSNFTPTGPALAGALMHAKVHAAANPDRLTVVVLATDGYPAVPTQCDPCGPPESLNEIRDAAAAAATTDPKVLTFVIGIGGVANLNGIAASGGTGKAFLIDTSGNVGADFAQAMRSIATTPLSCEFAIPRPDDGGSLQPNLVNVRFTPPAGSPQTIPRVSGPGGCNNGQQGWFYDDPNSPSKITLCDGTCDTLGAGTLQILLGCTTVVGPS